MYQGNPDQLLTHKAEFEKILDKWERKKGGEYRYDIVCEGDKLYITVILTKAGKDRKEKDAKIKELEDEVEKIKDKDPEPEPEPPTP